MLGFAGCQQESPLETGPLFVRAEHRTVGLTVQCYNKDQHMTDANTGNAHSNTIPLVFLKLHQVC